MLYFLFDVDGTLTSSGLKITKDMITSLDQIKKTNPDIILGIVGGGDYEKIKYQMDNCISLFEYIFCECGSVIYQSQKLILEKNMLDYVDRTYLNKIIKKALRLISDMDILYNGNSIDFRKGLIYISPPGLQAKSLEREFFKLKDKEHKLRYKLIKELSDSDPLNLFDFVLGGEVGVAMYLKGWDKSQVLKHFDLSKDIIYYFGDKTEPDGNDYPIYSNKYIKGISVKDYKDTINKIKEIITNLPQ